MSEQRRPERLAMQQSAKARRCFVTIVFLSPPGGSLENAAHLKLKLLMADPHMWMTIPPKHLSSKLRALAFVSVSRAGARIERLLGHPHRRLLYALFRILEQPSAAQDIESLPACLWDEWSRSFVGGDDLRNPSFRARLLIMAESVAIDVIPCEAGHSQLRRFLRARVQTHQLSPEDLSVQWVAQLIHEDGHVAAAVSKYTEGEQQADSSDNQVQPRPRSMACLGEARRRGDAAGESRHRGGHCLWAEEEEGPPSTRASPRASEDSGLPRRRRRRTSRSRRALAGRCG